MVSPFDCRFPLMYLKECNIKEKESKNEGELHQQFLNKTFYFTFFFCLCFIICDKLVASSYPNIRPRTIFDCVIFSVCSECHMKHINQLTSSIDIKLSKFFK